MPPKPKYTKSEIIHTAFEMTREAGIDSVVARAVGKRLGTSSSPIFTFFGNMNELKEEVERLARHRFREYMLDILDFTPAFKEFGMRWVRFAAEEPNLYRLLFLSQHNSGSLLQQFQLNFEDILVSMVKEIMTEFQLGEAASLDLLSQMLIFANGISVLMLSNAGDISEESVSYSLSKMCIGIVITDKLIDGTFELPRAKAMADSCNRGIQPVKKTK
ncbi:MAG: TetR/AcrR family transcriptional regulator [Acetatifactor sp.]